MGMNSKLHVLLKTEDFNKLLEEAKKSQVSLSDLCRLRLLQYHHFERIESMLEKIEEKIKYSTKHNTGG